jgi:D-glutamate cyclase
MAMPDEKTLHRIGEAVDRMITVDVSARGLIRTLYDGARVTMDDQPLALTAAKKLTEATKSGQPIIIATGLPVRGWFSPALAENDGPVGAATLARAAYMALDATPILICEEEQVPVLRACVHAAGLTVSTMEQIEAARRSPYAVPGREIPAAVVQGFPADEKQAVQEGKRLLELSPAALISIERQGANAKGVYHYGRGEANKRDIMAKVDELFEAAKARGTLTIGIGDGGNELGMGRIKDLIREMVPYGAKCQCPCGIGMAPEFVPDILICATVSNWGAWGISACLAAIAGNPHVLHTPEVELDVIRACTDAGGVDGLTAFIEPLVDALPARMCANIVEILQAIVTNGLNPPKLFRQQ